MERASFVFYRSFFDQLEELSADDAFPLYRAIARYGLMHEEPDLRGVQKVVFIGVRAQLEANWKRWENGCKGGAFGKLGGAPKGNRNARKTTPKQGQNNPKTTPNENDNVNENVNEKGGTGETDVFRQRRFTPPALAEVQEYIAEKGYRFDAQPFVDYYTSNGWRVGKNQMRDWKAALRNWQRRERITPQEPTAGTARPGFFDFAK